MLKRKENNPQQKKINMCQLYNNAFTRVSFLSQEQIAV